jgi:hypothetical protein
MPPTQDELKAKLSECREGIADAERELGAAELDGSDRRPAQRKLATARDDARRIEVALAELERREAKARQQAEAAEVAAERQRGLAWFTSYLGLAVEYQRSLRSLEDVVDRFRALPEVSSIYAAQVHGRTRDGLHDAELLENTRVRVPTQQEVGSGSKCLCRVFAGGVSPLSIDDWERLRAKAEALTAKEEEG